MKTVSLIYGYSSRNAGDFAITLGAIDLLLEIGCKVKLFSRYCTKNQDFFQSSLDIKKRYGDKIEIYESPFCLDRTDSKLVTLKNYIDGACSIMGLKSNKKFKSDLLSSDYIIFNGGNLFRCHSMIDYTRLQALMYPLHVALDNKKKIVIFPQSASTLNSAGRNLLIPVLKKADTVFFREKMSYEYMKKLMDVSSFHQTIDLAFFINKKNIPMDLRFKKRIAITLRFHNVGDIKYLPQIEIEKIFNYLGALLTKLEKDHSFVIVVQTNKDEELSKKFAQEHNIDLIKSNDPIELLSIYKGVDMLIGMRLHSIILALSVGTPCFGIFYKQWGLKNPGLMNDFGMSYQMMDNIEVGEKQLNENLKSIEGFLNNRDLVSCKLSKKVEQEHDFILSKLQKLR